MIITQKMYNDCLDSLKEQDWKRIRFAMEERMPEIKDWKEDVFRDYCSAIVRSGFKKEKLN
jgi:hypothetical protein